MKARALSLVAVSLLTLAVLSSAAVAQPAAPAGQTHRLYDGLTVYVLNDQGQDFKLDMDLVDLNIYASGPREVMFKVYDPDGKCVTREFIPDDGVASPNFPDRIGAWDHELQYFSNLYVKGTNPTIRWSAWSDPARLATQAKRTFSNSYKGAKGLWRIVLAGSPDNYVTLRLSPDLKTAVAGNQMWLHGSGKMLAKSYVYVPKGTVGMFFGAAEPDMPRTRNFKVTAPGGKVLFDGPAVGGYTATEGSWQKASVKFPPGEYDGKLMTVEVTPGAGDFIIQLSLQQPAKGAFVDYVGMGCQAVYCSDEQTAMAIKGGTIIVDDLVFWHPFQVRFYNWLKSHNMYTGEGKCIARPMDLRTDAGAPKNLGEELTDVFNAFRLLETSDGRGAPSWVNWAYGLSGYYGCHFYRTSWVLMPRKDVPDEVKAIIREGLIMAGDRLSFAINGERVNGNSFSQINVALWYCHRATGDELQKQRFELFWNRWKTEGWGPGAGLSPSGDSQEHFAHDMSYGSYLMDNWRGGIWVQPGIIGDANSAKDNRFAEVLSRYQELYSYLYCREAGKGAPIAANPWSSRTQASVNPTSDNFELDGHTWKGEPGKDFTVNVNNGNEWFAARRKNYYMLTYHGRLAPDWLTQTCMGQVGFSGGTICQLTVPGKGPVLAGILAGNYGYGDGMDPSNWRNFHIHSIVGQMWDDRPLVSGISEHANAKLEGSTVTSSGEVRNQHVKVSRSYTYGADGIDCSVNLAESDYARVMSIWHPERPWSKVKEAHELIPFLPMDPTGKKPTTVTMMDDGGRPAGAVTDKPAKAAGVIIDRGGFGVRIKFEKPQNVMLASPGALFIQIVAPGSKPAEDSPAKAADASGKPAPKPAAKPKAKAAPDADSVPADQVALKYKLIPFGN